MVNMMKLMKQAAEMQKNAQKMQAELADKTVEFTSGGGMVTAVARGDMTIASIKIDPQCVDPDDVEMLEDLVTTAVDGALLAAKDMAAEEMGKLTQGMGLPPGMGL
ncbi:MAG: YbaB/EbfC family nucleoid-associated protein [Verrucomicrobia bacterium]|nr:YbaB/EbfC family nucleoid-associated protein [Verrucomicrobiota bacterium]